MDIFKEIILFCRFCRFYFWLFKGLLFTKIIQVENALQDFTKNLNKWITRRDHLTYKMMLCYFYLLWMLCECNEGRGFEPHMHEHVHDILQTSGVSQNSWRSPDLRLILLLLESFLGAFWRISFLLYFDSYQINYILRFFECDF